MCVSAVERCADAALMLRRDVTVAGLVEKAQRLSAADKRKLYNTLAAMVGK